MVKRITTISELKTLCAQIKEQSEAIAKITKNQKHIFGDWNIDHIQDQVISSFLLNKEKTLIEINSLF